jgi:uncharacterized membrane protein YheB (UPF0754 family)
MIELATAAAAVGLPLGGAAVGWGTNALAVRMLFAPVERAGLGPFRWQGVIPARAERMAQSCADLLLGRLVAPQEVFDRIDAVALSRELEAGLVRAARAEVEAVVAARAPRVWPRLPARVRERILAGVTRELPGVVEGVLADLRTDLDRHLDVRGLITAAFLRDRRLLGELFWSCGEVEFRFIVASGFAFGLALGCVQLAAASLLSAGWVVLPLLGALIGGATNWVALRMVFQPAEPLRIGPWRLQGLFLRRQSEVSEAYARFFAERILTPANLLDAVLRGPAGERFEALVQRHVEASVDDALGWGKPVLDRALGAEGYADLRFGLAARVSTRAVPEAEEPVREHLEERLDLEATVQERMNGLDPESFVGVLRPVFQADEWLLTAIGAGLGLLAGVAQAALVTLGG